MYSWVEDLGGSTLLSSTTYPPHNNGDDPRPASSFILGNSPLSGITLEDSYPKTWHISNDFKIVVNKTEPSWLNFTFYDGNTIVAFEDDSAGDPGTSYYIGFGIDEEAEKAFYVIARNFGGTLYIGGYTGSAEELALYSLIKGAQIHYSWKSFTSLSLTENNNRFDPRYPFIPGEQLLLGYIPDEALASLDINLPVNGATDFVVQEPSINNAMPAGGERVIKLSNGNFASVKFSNNEWFINFVFYETGNVFYTAHNLMVGPYQVYLGFIYDSENSVARFNPLYYYRTYDSTEGIYTPYVNYNQLAMGETEMALMYEWLLGAAGDDKTPENTNEEQGRDQNDPVIHTPLNDLTLPTKGAAASGFIKMYKVEDSDLEDLCEYMWDDSLIENLGRLFGDPRDIIVGISVFPIAPRSEDMTAGVEIKAGNLSTGITASLLNTEYRTRSAGIARVAVGEADFFSVAPYRRIKLNIPYCGEHEIDPSAVYGRKLKLKYHISFFSGACVAEIDRSNDSDSGYEPFLFFSGQMGFQIPISSEDYTRVISAIISSGANLGAAMATGGATGLISSGIRQAGKMLSGGLAEGVSYNSGGGAGTGFLSTQQPYLIIEEAVKAFDDSQAEYVGNTYYMVKTLGSVTGYTKCFHAHIHGSLATGEELKEIDDWLTNGVIINSSGTPTPSHTPVTPGNIKLTFMKMSSDYNEIKKTWTNELAIEGKLLYDNSISNPVILIEGNLIGYNYCYIGIFSRFYYINDVKVVKNNMTEVHLKVDVLQSFKDDILGSKGAIERQAGHPNAFIEDPYIWAESKHTVKTVTFDEGGNPFDFKHSEDTYILTIAGT